MQQRHYLRSTNRRRLRTRYTHPKLGIAPRRPTRTGSRTPPKAHRAHTETEPWTPVMPKVLIRCLSLRLLLLPCRCRPTHKAVTARSWCPDRRCDQKKTRTSRRKPHRSWEPSPCPSPLPTLPDPTSNDNSEHSLCPDSGTTSDDCEKPTPNSGVCLEVLRVGHSCEERCLPELASKSGGSIGHSTHTRKPKRRREESLDDSIALSLLARKRTPAGLLSGIRHPLIR